MRTRPVAPGASLDVGPSWMHTNPHVIGLARAPGPPADAAAR
jgi:hypothetical protein